MDAVYKKTNTETNTEARVYVYTETPGWYTTTLVDLDSGLTVPSMLRVDSLAKAIAVADKWAAE